MLRWFDRVERMDVSKVRVQIYTDIVQWGIVDVGINISTVYKMSSKKVKSK